MRRYRILQSLSVFVFVLLIFPKTSLLAQTFRVATYNLRNANHGDSLEGNGWGQRYPVICQLIRFHEWDIFGTQEGKYHQLVDLADSLPGFTWIGIGRDDGKQAGEFSAIFYRKEKFELLSRGDFWLSDTTDRPNRAWDAALPRICSWGRFKEKESGLIFFFFNLHMDHIGVKARAESARLILKKVKELAGSQPAIVTGDFNVDQTSEPYKLLNGSGIFRDAYNLSPLRYALNGTFNNFKTDQKTESRIDHIFLSTGFTPTRYGILTDNYRAPVADSTARGSGNSPKEVSLDAFSAREPSDHFPVMIEVNYKR